MPPQLPIMHKYMQDTPVATWYAVKLLRLPPWHGATENRQALEALWNEARQRVAENRNLSLALESPMPLPTDPTSIEAKVQEMV